MYTGTDAEIGEDADCVCSIDKEATETKCVCLSSDDTGETDLFVIDCGEPVPKRRTKRASLPDANPLPASESEEGDKRKHGQDDTAPVNPGEDQLLRARRSTLKQLLRSAPAMFSSIADTQTSNDTSCYKPEWCGCLCNKVRADDEEASCMCVNMPEWSCTLKKANKGIAFVERLLIVFVLCTGVNLLDRRTNAPPHLLKYVRVLVLGLAQKINTFTGQCFNFTGGRAG